MEVIVFNKIMTVQPVKMNFELKEEREARL